MGKLKLAVGMYSCDTHDLTRAVPYITSENDITPLINTIETQLKALSDVILNAGMGNFGVQGVLVFPEYYFAASDGQVTKRGVSKLLKERIITRLCDLSRKKYPSIILIPGTIAWEDSVIGTITNKSNFSFNKGSDKKLPGLVARTNWNLPSATLVGRGSDLGVQKLNSYTVANKQTVTLQINTAPIIHNGKVVGEYNKASDFKESSVPGTMHVPFPYPGNFSVTTHKGTLTIGLEICLDHVGHVLEAWHNANVANDAPNLQVICSACVDSEYALVQPGGALLHASSEPGYTQYYAAGAWSAGLGAAGLLSNVIEVDL